MIELNVQQYYLMENNKQHVTKTGGKSNWIIKKNQMKQNQEVDKQQNDRIQQSNDQPLNKIQKSYATNNLSNTILKQGKEFERLDKEENILNLEFNSNNINWNKIMELVLNKSTYIATEKNIRGQDWYIKTLLQSEQFKMGFQILVKELTQCNEIVNEQISAKVFIKLEKWIRNRIDFQDNIKQLSVKCEIRESNINSMIENRLSALESKKEELIDHH